MLNLPGAFVYFRWSWSCYFGLGLGLVSSGFGLGLVTLVLVLVLRILSCLHHWLRPLDDLHHDRGPTCVWAAALRPK